MAKSKRIFRQSAKPREVVKFVPDRRRVSAVFDNAQTTTNNARYWSLADALSADAAARPEVRYQLRIRCRYEVQNNCYARGLVDLIANDTVGNGPRLQMLFEDEELNDRIEYDFKRWADEVGLTRDLILMRKERCQNGEAFCILSYNPKLDNPVKLNLLTIEADRVAAEYENILDDTDVDGIKYDKYGNPVSYRVLKYHPNELNVGYGLDAFQVDADHMLHTFVRLRSGQHRGIPELTPALEQFAQLRRYSLAELSAAETMADLAGVLYTDAPAGGEAALVDPLETIPFERNMLMSLPAGWKIGSPDSKHPTSNHQSFVKVNLAEIARSVCATYGTISGDFSGFNYASGRLDNQIYQKSIIVDRTNWERDVLNRVFKAWIREWCLVNMVELPSDAPHTWFWDGFLHVDPTKQANATKTELETMATTLPDVYAAKGQDYRIAFKKIASTIKMCKELGIPIELLYPALAKKDEAPADEPSDDADDEGEQ